MATLCVTEIVSWGVLFYAFPVALPSIVSQSGWSATVVSGAFSVGLLAAAGAGIGVGRLLDQRGPRLVMTTGSVAATVAVIVIALAPNPGTFMAGWLLAGLAQAAVLYPPAFAALTRWYGVARVRALTTLTLVAGLASTVFAPVTAVLLEQLGWRHAYLVLATVLGIVTIPAHAFGLRALWPSVRGEEPPAMGELTNTFAITSVTPILKSRPFLMLATATAMTAFTFGAATISLVPLLTARGWSGLLAAWALGLTGLAQLLGRIGYPALHRRTQPRTRTILVPLLAAPPLAALAISIDQGAILTACILLGIARGGSTLVESTAIADRWRDQHYGALYGLMSAPALIGIALSPWASAELTKHTGGYPQLFALLAALTVVAELAATGTKVIGSGTQRASRTPPRSTGVESEQY